MTRDAQDSPVHDSTVVRAEDRFGSPVHTLSDLELLARVRGGDDAAFGELYNRHADAVRAFASRNYGSTTDPDDLAAEAFFRVLQAVRRGTARIEHMRAYLLTVTRRVAWEWSARRRDVPVDDEELTRRSEVDAERPLNSDERNLITRAFTSLPERWRSVLWRVEVEGERPAVIAGHYGLSPNATAALARRARDGLRAAYLQAHLASAPGPVTCRNVVEKLGAFTAGGVRGAEERRIAAHLEDCESCSALHSELAEVCAGLRVHASAIMGPAIGLGTALGSGGFGAAAGKAAFVGTRVKLAVAASAAAGVGVLGVSVGPMIGEHHVSAAPDYDGVRGDRQLQVCTECAPGSDNSVAALPPQQSAQLTPQQGVDGRAVAGDARAHAGPLGAMVRGQRLPLPGYGDVAGPPSQWLVPYAEPSAPGKHAAPEPDNTMHTQSAPMTADTGAGPANGGMTPQNYRPGWDSSDGAHDHLRPRPTRPAGEPTSEDPSVTSSPDAQPSSESPSETSPAETSPEQTSGGETSPQPSTSSPEQTPQEQPASSPQDSSS